MRTECGHRDAHIHRVGVFVDGGEKGQNGVTTEDGPGGCANTRTPALTPESARAPMNDAASIACRQQGPGWRAKDLTLDDVRSVLDRFITKFTPGSPDDCWAWAGRRMPSGYGVITGPGRIPLLAHRVSWVAFTGAALTGHLTIDHLCNTRWCVNPAHLEPVSMAENLRRRNQRLGCTPGGRGEVQAARPTPCPECGQVMRRSSLIRHRKSRHAEAA